MASPPPQQHQVPCSRPTCSHFMQRREQPPRPPALSHSKSLDGHLDQMSDAATNSSLTLFHITDANARLDATTSNQYETIKKLLTDIKLSSSSPNPRSSSTGAGAGTTNDQKTIKLLQAAIKKSLVHRRVLLLPRMGRWPPTLKQHLQEQVYRARGHCHSDQSCRPWCHQKPRMGRLRLTAWVSSEN